MCRCKQLQWGKCRGSALQFWVESRNSAEGRRKGELLTLFFSAEAAVALSRNYKAGYM